MKKSVLLLSLGLGFLALICQGNANPEEDNSDLDPKEREVDNAINDMLKNYMSEITTDFESARRYPESKISSEPADVHFFLYYNGAQNETLFQEIVYNSERSLQAAAAQIIPNAPWKVLIHGFTQNQNSSCPQVLVKEYLKSKLAGKQYNILVVDWGQLAYSLQISLKMYYHRAVQNVPVAGNRVGEMIDWLRKMNILDLENVHVLGFSLGAHVAGEAGKYFRNMYPDPDSSYRIDRITGLDPAGPFFYGIGRQLCKDDARTLDIIHTSWGGYGIAKEIGQADFFPNAPPSKLTTQIQPWCVRHLKAPFVVCSHNLAPVYYAISINHPEAMNSGCKCSSPISFRTFCGCTEKGTLGENWSPKQVGSFYLKIMDLDKKIDGMGGLKRKTPQLDSWEWE